MKQAFHKTVRLTTLLAVALTGSAGQPGFDFQSPDLALTVRLYDYAGVPEGTRRRARIVANQIFQHAGVKLDWLMCWASEDTHIAFPACRQSLTERDVIVRVRPYVPAQFQKARFVCGIALVPQDGSHGKHVSVFYDRVEQLTWDRLTGATSGIFAGALPSYVCTGLTLGTVIAHEIGHLLLGVSSHSRDGIMKARWCRQDLEDAYWGRQAFTREQTRRLRADILARADAQRGGLIGLASN